MTQRHIRYRTCIATRNRLPDTQLLRLVADRDEPRRILADPHRRLPGRGAWITPSLAAVDRAEHKRAIGRALRIAGRVDTGHVREHLETQEQSTGNGPFDPEIVRKTEH